MSPAEVHACVRLAGDFVAYRALTRSSPPTAAWSPVPTRSSDRSELEQGWNCRSDDPHITVLRAVVDEPCCQLPRNLHSTSIMSAGVRELDMEKAIPENLGLRENEVTQAASWTSVKDMGHSALGILAVATDSDGRCAELKRDAPTRKPNGDAEGNFDRRQSGRFIGP
jgi:hypothetical protein